MIARLSQFLRNTLPLVFALVLVIGVLAYSVMQFIRPSSSADVIEGQDGWLYPGWDRLAEDETENTDLGIARVQATQEQLTSRGVELVVLLIPAKVRIGQKHLPVAIRPDVSASNGYNDLIAKLKNAGITVFDASPRLKAREEAGEPTFSPRDSHWTAPAAEAVASDLAEMIASRTNITMHPTADSLGKWKTETRYSDLVALLRKRGDHRFGKDQIDIRAYTAELSGDPRILVIGNSFVETIYGLPRYLSYALETPVGFIAEYGAEGPWKAMTRALERSNDPQLIVWQLQEASFANTPPPEGG